MTQHPLKVRKVQVGESRIAIIQRDELRTCTQSTM